MSCKPILVYQDLDKRLHTSEGDCCRENIRIKERRKVDRLMQSYKQLFPVDLDPMHKDYPGARLVREFLEKISNEGYIIIKEKDING